jgi:hypothetical protein
MENLTRYIQTGNDTILFGDNLSSQIGVRGHNDVSCRITRADILIECPFEAVENLTIQVQSPLRVSFDEHPVY